MIIKNNLKKNILYILYTLLVVFILFNIFLIIQAYSFTHSVNESSEKLKDQSILSKLLIGQKIPRAYNDSLPVRQFETVRIPAKGDNSLEAWVLKTDSVPKGFFILFHGYTDNAESMLSNAYLLLDMGYDVMLPNFIGTGNSYGDYSTMGGKEAENVKQAYDYAIQELHADNISLLGMSMGAAAISKAMHDYNLEVNCIILEAIYGKLTDAVSVRMPIKNKVFTYGLTFWGSVLNNFNGFKMNPQDFVKDFRAPTLMLYGGKDQRIPTQEALRIYNNIGSDIKECYMFTDAEHENYSHKWPEEWATVVSEFLTDKVENQQ